MAITCDQTREIMKFFSVCSQPGHHHELSLIAFSLFLGNPNLCRQVTQSSTLRDVEWATQTCTLTFETIGIWPDGADGTDVNVASRSHDKNLIATGDDFGKVKLYAFPANKPKVRSWTGYVFVFESLVSEDLLMTPNLFLLLVLILHVRRTFQSRDLG
jgi:hypothetical protein